MDRPLNIGIIGTAGVDRRGAARIVELSDHRFFMATLFLPQTSSTPETPHPLFTAFLNAAMAFRDEKPSGA